MLNLKCCSFGSCEDQAVLLKQITKLLIGIPDCYLTIEKGGNQTTTYLVSDSSRTNKPYIELYYTKSDRDSANVYKVVQALENCKVKVGIQFHPIALYQELPASERLALDL